MGDLNFNSGNVYKSKQILKFQPFTVHRTKNNTQLKGLSPGARCGRAVLMLSSSKCKSIWKDLAQCLHINVSNPTSLIQKKRTPDDIIHLLCQVTHSAQRNGCLLTQFCNQPSGTAGVSSTAFSSEQRWSPEAVHCKSCTGWMQSLLKSLWARWVWLSVKLRCFSMPLDSSEGVWQWMEMMLFGCPLLWGPAWGWNHPHQICSRVSCRARAWFRIGAIACVHTLNRPPQRQPPAPQGLG